MTRRLLGLSTATVALFAGCLDDNKKSIDTEATPKPVVKRAELPPMVEAAKETNGALADKLMQVKLPTPKSGDAQSFKFGKGEYEREAWVAKLPESGQLVTVAYAKHVTGLRHGCGRSRRPHRRCRSSEFICEPVSFSTHWQPVRHRRRRRGIAGRRSPG